MIMNEIMKYFKYSHLPEHLQSVSKAVGELPEDEVPPNGS